MPKGASPSSAASSPLAAPSFMPMSLEELLKQWAFYWAKEKDTSLDWIALNAQTLSEKRKPDSFYCQANLSWLEVKPLKNEDIVLIDATMPIEQPTMLKNLIGASPNIINHISAVHPTTISLKKALSTTVTVRCSSEMTYNAGFELNGGLSSIGNFKATLGLALKKGKAEDSYEFELNEKELTQVLNAKAGKHTLTDIELIESTTTQIMNCKLHLHGGVIISCKNKVTYVDKAHPNRQEKHYRWFVPIQEIFQDIERYTKDTSLPSHIQQLFQRAVSNVTILNQKVQFILQASVVSKTHIAPKINLQKSQLQSSSVSNQASSDAKAASAASSRTDMVAFLSALADKPYTKAKTINHNLTADELNKMVPTVAKAAADVDMFSHPAGSRTFLAASAYAGAERANAETINNFAPALALPESKEEEEDKMIQSHEEPASKGEQLVPVKKALMLKELHHSSFHSNTYLDRSAVAIGDRASAKNETHIHYSEKYSAPDIINNLYQSCHYFQERPDKLLALNNILISQSNKSIKRLAITGIAGSGKTELAAAFVSQLPAPSSGSSLVKSLRWWIDCSDDNRLFLSIENLAAKLLGKESIKGLSTENPELKKVKIIQAVHEKLIEYPEWILVFDNTLNPSQIKEYIPLLKTHSGTIIVTSQQKNFYGGSHEVMLNNGLTSDEAKALALSCYSDARTYKELLPGINAEHFEPLLDHLGYLPLAITVAVIDFARENQSRAEDNQPLPLLTPEQYLKEYIANSDSYKRGYALIQHHAIAHSQLEKYKAIQEHVIANALSKLDESVFALFTSCALLGGKELPSSLLADIYQQQLPESATSLSPLEQLNQLLASTFTYSLLNKSISANKTIYYFHQVTCEQIIMLAEKKVCLPILSFKQHQENLRQLMQVPIIQLYEYLEQADDDKNYATMRQLLPQFDSIKNYYSKWQLVSENDKDYYNLLDSTARVYVKLGFYQKAEILYEEILAIDKKNHDDNHPRTAITLGNLANVYGLLGRYEKKIKLLEQVLPIIRKDRDEMHSDIAVTLMNLANAYGDLGDYYNKKILLEQALPINKRLNNHIDIATTLEGLAITYHESGEHNISKNLINQALSTIEKHDSNNHLKTAGIHNNIAIFEGDLGNHQKKKELLEQKVLPIYEDHYGLKHIKTARIVNNLALAYGELGDKQKEIELLNQVLPIFKIYYGPENSDTIKTFMNLAIAYRELGDFQKQKETLEQVLPFVEQYYGRKHEFTAKARLLLEAAKKKINSSDVDNMKVHDQALTSVKGPGTGANAKLIASVFAKGCNANTKRRLHHNAEIDHELKKCLNILGY